MTASVICPRCGAQCCATVAADRGWRAEGCPRCPPDPTDADPHPLEVNFAWVPDYPEHCEEARPRYTAACGCGWRVSFELERDAWVAALDHAGRLDGWRTRPLLVRPRPDARPTDKCWQRWHVEVDRLPGIPMRTLMACADDGSGCAVHACRGVIPPDGFAPGELCACACHELDRHDADPCQHCHAGIGHRGDCPTRDHRRPPALGSQLELF